MAIDTLVRQTGLKHTQNAVVMVAKINQPESKPAETLTEEATPET